MMTLDDFHERAAIMEYDGGMTRAVAERSAWLDVMRENIPSFIDLVIWAASPADDLAVAAAKKWIAERGLTAADVSLKKSAAVVYVVTKNG